MDDAAGGVGALAPTAALADPGWSPRLLGDGGLLALVAFLAVFAGALGWCLWNYGLRHLAPTQVAVYVNLNPLVATILSVWLLGEGVSVPFVAGFVAVGAGVVFVNWPARRTE